MNGRSKSVSSLHEKPSEETKDAPQKKLPNIQLIFARALQATQHEGLKVLTPDTIYQAYADIVENASPDQGYTPISEFTQEDCLQIFMTEISVLFTEQNKRFKVTVKKKYINDILMMSKGAQNLAQQVVIVVTNNAALALNSAKKIRRVKRNISMEMDSDEEGEEGVDGEPSDRTIQKIPGQKTPQVTSNKAKVAVINARRGYESENE